MKKLIFILFMYTLLSICLAVDKIGTSAAKFLSIGSGAQAIGMGGAYTAIAKDASSMYWNPAGIARVSSRKFYFDHSNWLADLQYDYSGLILPLKYSSAIGFNITSLSMPEMNVTRYGEENTGETFKAGSYAFGFVGAINLTYRFSIGFNMKYIKEYISKSHASAIALDIGTLFNTKLGPTIGMSISNFGPKLKINGTDLLITTNDISNNPDINANLSTEEFNLPLCMRFGIANTFVMNSVDLLIAIDAVSPIDNSEYVNLGAELSFFDKLFLRTGMKSLFMIDREEMIAFGGGIKMHLFSKHNIQFDYAYEVRYHLNDIHKFSIQMTR